MGGLLTCVAGAMMRSTGCRGAHQLLESEVKDRMDSESIFYRNILYTLRIQEYHGISHVFFCLHFYSVDGIACHQSYSRGLDS